MAARIEFSQYGPAEVLELRPFEVPEPGPGEVLVRVRAAAVNAIDWKLRRGFMPSPLPSGTGLEMSGVVEGGDPRFTPGQAVFGLAPGTAVATHTLARADDLLPKPDDLTFEQAAALPVAAETAFRTLRRLALLPGERLLVHAVAGGVGLAAAQTALSRGAGVVGTASPRHHDYLRSLGVEPIVYGDGWPDRAGRVDAILDASGRGELAESLKLTSRVVSIASHDVPELFSSASTEGVPLAEVFAELLPVVRLPIAAVFPLGRTAEAHRLSEEGHLRGKIVIAIAEGNLPR
ncbi:NADP-dependent oxidoreductase [Nonomuraea soli]|uniref:Acetyl esterase n=1 Tax=Nonomuraea soli TaxID=1032476 RepID=A0A7W0CNJ6_9ACTN|nr:NADP-dependent oxidoreductase [Nonomuraea soli]MBA2894363.1 acetyl esterase [Nonomuraea soli]